MAPPHTLPAWLAPLAWAALAGCSSTTPMVAFPRSPLAMPPAIADRYHLPDEVTEVQLVPLTTIDAAIQIHRGILSSGPEEAEFHYLHPRGNGPHPTVALLPILAGGDALMWMAAEGLAERGFAVLWAKRVASALKPGQRGSQLEQLFRRTVIHNRMVLEWARRQQEVDATRLGLVGLSTGGVVGGVLMAVEEDLRGGVLCLAGGDLPRLLGDSAENRIIAWRRWRAITDGVAGRTLADELHRDLVSDPALLGPYVGTERILLVGATLDRVVSQQYQTVLWEAFGRPEWVHLPLTHYSAALSLGRVLDMGGEFLRQRFATSPPRTAP